MKKQALAVCMGLAALATGAVALAEAEDALLRRYPYDPACPWGRIGNGKGMVVRCISEAEAQGLKAATKAVAKTPAAAAPSASAAKTPASSETSASPDEKEADAAVDGEESEQDAEASDVKPESDALEVTVGPITADEGKLGIGRLDKPKDRYIDCVRKHGGLKDKTGEVSVRFLVRGKGVAEGVSVSKRQNISKEAAQCVAEVVDRRRVGTPDAPHVGATLLVKFAKVTK